MLQDTRTVTERVLSDAWGTTVSLATGVILKDSGRAHVYRYAIRDGNPDPKQPTSVVVKRAQAIDGERYETESPQGPAWRLFNDWAGIRFLSEQIGEKSPAPQYYAGSRSDGVFVMEDLGSVTRLDQLLLGNNPQAATEGLMAYIVTMGRMHAMTVGRRAAFEKIRNSLGPRPPEPAPGRVIEVQANKLQLFAGNLGIVLQPGVERDFRRLARFLDKDNPFMAYSNNDPCPDNCLISGSEARLVDFEFGSYRHALLDGVYGRIHFPTCWCVNRLPPRVYEEMEEGYRRELARGCAAAADEGRFRQAVVEACAWRLLTTLYLEVLGQDRVWGISTLRQRTLVRLDRFAEISAAVGHLKILGALARNLASALRAQWPPETDEMPLYPAFRPSVSG